MKIKKFRYEHKLFCVEGLKSILELMGTHFEVERVVGTEVLLNAFEERGLDTSKFHLTSKSVVTSLGSLKTNEVGLAVVHMKKTNHWKENEGVILALDDVSDPGNLGTIIRTMDWYGYYKLFCSEQCADLYNPKTIAASMGSFLRVSVQYGDLRKFIVDYSGDETYGMVLDGIEIRKAGLKDGIYVLGSESHGISGPVINKLKTPLTIKKYGQAESLNVGLATGILLQEIRNQVP